MISFLHERKEDMLNGNIFISHRLRVVLSIDECLVRVLREIHLPASRYLRKLPEFHLDIRLKLIKRHTQLL